MIVRQTREGVFEKDSGCTPSSLSVVARGRYSHGDGVTPFRLHCPQKILIFFAKSHLVFRFTFCRAVMRPRTTVQLEEVASVEAAVAAVEAAVSVEAAVAAEAVLLQ